MKLSSLGGSNNDGLFRAENGVIYFRKFREGKGEIFRSTKCKDLTRARKKRDEFLIELWGDAPLKVKRLIVSELWESWYLGMEETKSKATAQSIRTTWVNLKSYIDNKFLDEITNEWWVNSYISLKRQEPNPRAKIDNANRKFFNDWKWMSGFLKWCEANGKGDIGWRRPKLLNPDPPRAPGKIYSSDQLLEIKGFRDDRMRTLVVMGEQHFMRRSEAILLEWDRVDLNKRTIRLRAEDTKIRKERTFTINEELAGRLKEMKLCAKSRYVFPSQNHTDQPITVGEFRVIWDAAKKAAGIEGKANFHWLRHTGLTKAFKRPNISAALICFFAGLSLEEAQKTYLHYSVEDLRGVENLVGQDGT